MKRIDLEEFECTEDWEKWLIVAQTLNAIIEVLENQDES